METFEIIDFDWNNKDHLNMMGDMHNEFLPESNVPGFGKLFMNKFYYKVLPQLGLLKCYFPVYNGEIAGMIVTNKYPFSLISRGMKGRSVLLMYIFGVSVLMKPSIISRIIQQLKYKPNPLLKKYEDEGAFEILTIGVKGKFRPVRVNGNKKIAHMMVDNAIEHYKKKGAKYITGQIKKSNQSALKFYEAYNARYIDSTTDPEGVIMEVDLGKVNS